MKNRSERNTQEATSPKTPRVSIVDDDESVREAINSLLRSVGLHAQVFASAEEFLNSGYQHHAGCLILDVRMPGMNGLQLFEELKVRAMRFPVIFITACIDDAPELRARELGAVGYFKKPFNAELLMRHVQDVLGIKTVD